MRIELNTRTNIIKKDPLKSETGKDMTAEVLAMYAKAVGYEMTTLCQNPGQDQKFLDTFVLMVKGSAGAYRGDDLPKV